MTYGTLVIKMSLNETRNFFEFLIGGLSNRHTTIYVTNKQLRLIQNAVFNIFFNNSLQFSDKDKTYFKRHTKYLKLLANKYTSQTEKRDIITSKRPLMKRVSTVVIQYADGQ